MEDYDSIWQEMSGILEFERNKTAKRYEDEYVVMERDEKGMIKMTGKPLKSVFIYPDDVR